MADNETLAALFFSGCGADQNPLPRREPLLAQRYGEMLTAAVEEVLLQHPEPLAPTLEVAHAFVPLKLGDTPTATELEQMARVLNEDKPPRASSRWGYEGNTSMYVYGQPAHRWADDVEHTIALSVQNLVKQVKRE